MAALLTVLLVVLSTPARFAAGEPARDREALLDFISGVPHARRVAWNATASACDWVGVTCDAARSAVLELRLPASGLVGPIPPATVGRLSSLRVLSLRSNALIGTIPPDLTNLTHLRGLYLQNNRLSGEIPQSIAGLTRLTRLDLSRNSLSGELPVALTRLTSLTGLFLQENHLAGSIPSIAVVGLVDFNVSHNLLNGSVPEPLRRFPASSFAGNLDLCGGPLPPCPPFFPAPAPGTADGLRPPGTVERTRRRRLSAVAIVGIAVGSALLALILLLICYTIRRSSGRGGKKAPSPPKGEAGGTSSSMEAAAAAAAASGCGEGNRLVFVGDGGGYSFDLEDLLRASAEVLGKGSLGTSYKAVLEEGTTVVVKRLKDVSAARREFEQCMESLSHVHHPNLLPLRAYYYSKDEKLLVFDYVPAGSLSSLLHRRASATPPLDWDSRVRIAVAAGRGLAHLHDAVGVVHGDVKASNVLVLEAESAGLSDYGLAPLFGARAAGYRAPEAARSFKSDVYGFGVVLMEMLTGRSPEVVGEGVDLPRWVQSAVREEWTAEVFDAAMVRYPNVEEEMVQLLQIAMACVAAAPEERPDARDVVRLMEEVARRAETSDDGLAGSSDDARGGGAHAGVVD